MPPDDAVRATGGYGSEHRSHTGAAPVVDIAVMPTAPPAGKGRALPADGPALDELADPAVDRGPPEHGRGGVRGEAG